MMKEITVDKVNVQNIEMKYCKFGQGEKNLVIIPGLSFKPVTDNAEAVAAAYHTFADDYTVWLFDVRSNTPDHYSIEDIARDTVTVMKSLGIETTALFGTSMGGMISQYIALRNPEMISKLILGSTICRNNETSKTSIPKWNKLAKDGLIDELVAQCIDDMYSKAMLSQYRDIMIDSNKNLTDQQVAEFIKRTQAIMEFDVADEVAKLKCPVFVIGCEGDNVLGGQGSIELSQILGCQLYMYSIEYGHCVYDEAPDYKARMKKFLE